MKMSIIRSSLAVALLLLVAGNGIAQSSSQPPCMGKELSNPKKPDLKRWGRVSGKLRASFASKDIRYAKENVPRLPKDINYWGETAWKGERLGTQILLWSNSKVEDVKITLSDLETQSGLKLSSKNFKLGVIRYVMSDTLGYSGNGCVTRMTNKNYDSTLVADVIDYNANIIMEPNTVLPLWLSLDVPEDASGGKYKGFVTITAKGLNSPIVLTTNVFVRNRTLPPHSQWSFYLDMWQNPYAVAKAFNFRPWSKEHFEALSPIAKNLARGGQKTITIPLFDNPFNGVDLDQNESMLTWIKRVDDTWNIDFTKFDMWVELMMNADINSWLNCHIGVEENHSIPYFDQATLSMKTLDCKFGSKEYDNFISQTFTLLVKYLEEKDWLSKSSIYVKDASREQLRKIISLAKSADARLKVSFSGKYYDDLASSVSSYAIPITQDITPAQIKQLRSSGKNISFYTTCSDARPNSFIFSPPADIAWMFWFAAANGFNGYTHQSVNTWTSKPCLDARQKQWPAGYNFLIYPGNRSSIRLERLIEGIQDYEKINILRQEFEEKNNAVELDKLNKVLLDFKLNDIEKASSSTIIEDARIILNSL